MPRRHRILTDNGERLDSIHRVGRLSSPLQTNLVSTMWERVRRSLERMIQHL